MVELGRGKRPCSGAKKHHKLMPFTTVFRSQHPGRPRWLVCGITPNFNTIDLNYCCAAAPSILYHSVQEKLNSCIYSSSTGGCKTAQAKARFNHHRTLDAHIECNWRKTNQQKREGQLMSTNSAKFLSSCGSRCRDQVR